MQSSMSSLSRTPALEARHAVSDATYAPSHMGYYMQEAMWKGAYVLLGACLCFCVCVHFFDVFLFHHAILFFTTTHTDSFMTLDVTEAFATMLLLCAYVTIICVLPLCVYTCLTFVNPCCFRLEARLLLCASALSACVFVLSYALAMHVVCPCVWHFFLHQEHMHAWHYAPRLAPYVSMLVQVCTSMHVVCQLPCVAIVLHVFWRLPHHLFMQSRKTMHVVLLLVSAFVCPPDMLTQGICWCCFMGVMESVLFFVCVNHAYHMSVTAEAPFIVRRTFPFAGSKKSFARFPMKSMQRRATSRLRRALPSLHNTSKVLPLSMPSPSALKKLLSRGASSLK